MPLTRTYSIPSGKLIGVFERGEVVNLFGVEDDDVGPETLLSRRHGQ